MTEIGEAHGALASQVALALQLQRGHLVIPKSATPARMASNLAARDIRLSDADMDGVAGLERGQQLIDPDWGPNRD